MVSAETLIEQIYQRDAKLKREDVKKLSDWAEMQLHLPKMSELQVLLFLHSCYYSNERAKETIDNFFTVRTHFPEAFLGRNPERLLDSLKVAVHVILPKPTPEGNAILYAKVTDPDPSKLDQMDQIKLFDMNMMGWYRENGPPNGVVAVLDMEGMSFGHVTRYGIVATKKFFFYIQEAMPLRLKQVHVINVAGFVDKLFAIAKPFIKKELLDLIHFHTHSLETFFKNVPQECLPNRLGGTAGTPEQLYELQRDCLLRNAKFFAEEDEQLVDESKRPGKPKSASTLFGVEGTFKRLEID